MQQPNIGISNLTQNSEEGLAFTNYLRFSHFIHQHWAVGAEVGFSGLQLIGGVEAITETAFAIPAIVSLDYFLLSGNVRPFLKIGAGPQLFLIGNDAEKDEQPNGINDAERAPGNDKEKQKAKIGAIAGASVGLDWQVYKGFGVQGEVGLFYDYLKNQALETENYINGTSLQARFGMFFKF